ncbi:MAG: hypothetical protein KY459_15705 [Acidobacteria bacterium]|nr:hypothetical protein [Acidobacteriota bacterium]
MRVTFAASLLSLFTLHSSLFFSLFPLHSSLFFSLFPLHSSLFFPSMAGLLLETPLRYDHAVRQGGEPFDRRKET